MAALGDGRRGPQAVLLAGGQGGRRGASGALVSMLVVPFVSQYGIVDLTDEGTVTGFRSEPVLPYWVNGGVYVFEQSVRELLPDKGDHEESTFPELARAQRLIAYK